MRASKARAGHRVGNRVTGAGAHTASSKAKEEGKVHRAPPPHQHRSARRGVLRTKGRCCPGGWLTWTDYELEDLEYLQVASTGQPYRARPSRRTYYRAGWPTAPARDAALKDKIVQRATVAVLNAIYEEDFLGFSYGFRPSADADAL